MCTRRVARSRWRPFAVTVGLLGLAVGAGGCSSSPRAARTAGASATTASAPAKPSATATAATAATAATPSDVRARLTRLTSNNVLIIGDSWTFAIGATDQAHGWAEIAARALGWNATVAGYPGAGYVNISNGRTLVQDIAAIRSPYPAPALVVIQGSTNDFPYQLPAIAAAVTEAVETVRTRWPTAQIVLIGPMAPFPWLAGQAGQVSAAIGSVASAAKVVLFDAEREQWLPSAQLDSLIGAKVVGHPSDAGYAQIAARFVAHIRSIGS